MLQGSFGVDNDGSVISKDEVTEQLLKCFCVGMRSPEVKQNAVKTVTDLYSTVLSRSSMTYLCIMLKKMPNRVGSSTQPCFMLLTVGKDPERSLFNLTWLHWSLYSWITMLRNFSGQPRHSMITHSPFLMCQMPCSGLQRLYTLLRSAPCISLGVVWGRTPCIWLPCWLWTDTRFW